MYTASWPIRRGGTGTRWVPVLHEAAAGVIRRRLLLPRPCPVIRVKVRVAGVKPIANALRVGLGLRDGVREELDSLCSTSTGEPPARLVVSASASSYIRGFVGHKLVATVPSQLEPSKGDTVVNRKALSVEVHETQPEA